MALIKPERVREIIIDVLFNQDEIVDGKIPEDTAFADGIIAKAGFHRGRLESHKDEIKSILENLPINFRKSNVGGRDGDSIFRMCFDKNNDRWGTHANVEELCLLSIALDLGEFPIPRELWIMLPGGVPVFSIKY